MKYHVELERMSVGTTHHRIVVEIEAESDDDAVEAAIDKAERVDLPIRPRKPRVGEWRRSHGHEAKSIEVLGVVSQPS